jgi:ureidoglycolate hydrolase
LGEDGTVSYLEVERKNRELFLDKMERHQNALEGFIPIAGVGFFCVAPANTEGKTPNIDLIEAFFIDGSCSFFLAPGVWHCIPFAFTPQLKFVILLKKSTVEKDVDIVEVSHDLEIALGR